MALTKKQKGVLIDQATKGMSESKAAVFTEFKGVGVEDFKKLRRELKKVNADMKVVKKRLLNIALLESIFFVLEYRYQKSNTKQYA